jgi:serine-threonine kinase receptor-associated protein
MAANLRQTPLTCSGHTRPVVQLAFSGIVDSGYYVISACKGTRLYSISIYLGG